MSLKKEFYTENESSSEPFVPYIADDRDTTARAWAKKLANEECLSLETIYHRMLAEAASHIQNAESLKKEFPEFQPGYVPSEQTQQTNSSKK